MTLSVCVKEVSFLPWVILLHCNLFWVSSETCMIFSDKLQNQLQNISSSSGFGAPQVVDDVPPGVSRTSGK